MNGQPNPAANCCRNNSSDRPLSRQINSSSDSCDPFVAATRQAFCQLSSLSGLASVADANKFFIDNCAMVRESRAVSRLVRQVDCEPDVPVASRTFRYI